LKQEAAKAGEYLDQLLRARADYDNALKRAERQKGEFTKFAEQAVVMEFLTILDDLERTKEAADEKHSPEILMQGVSIIYKHLMDILGKRGVAAIDEENVPFDTQKHQIVNVVKSPETKEPTVTKILRKGYALGDFVVRPASVEVKIAPEETEDSEKKSKETPQDTTKEDNRETRDSNGTTNTNKP
jgi:molecular chaperone GrpE